MFCVTSALSISGEHLNHPSLLVRSVSKFHVYFYVRLILHDLRAPLPYEDGFNKVENSYIKSFYYNICDDYGVNPNKTWIYGDWFYTTHCNIFTSELNAIKRSPPDNLALWIITSSKGFTNNGIEKIIRPVRAYVYLVLTSHVQTRSGIVGNSAPALDAQQSLRARSKH